jgi:hypothetical protein
MPSKLAEHCSFWFVAKRPSDATPAVNAALTVHDRQAFALSLVKAVEAAGIKALKQPLQSRDH